MRRVRRVEPLPDYKLAVSFDDGLHGEVCIKDRLFGPVFEPLRDPAFFVQAWVDEFGVVCWPNGADLDPGELYRKIASRP